MSSFREKRFTEKQHERSNEEKTEDLTKSYESHKNQESFLRNPSQENINVAIAYSILNEVLIKSTTVKKSKNVLKTKQLLENNTKLIKKNKSLKKKNSIKYTVGFGKYNRKSFTKETSRHGEKSFHNKFRRRKKTQSFRKSVKDNNREEDQRKFTRGKRGLLGGKAKEKYHDQGNLEKNDSDEDSDKFYFCRVSLGYFQKFHNNSGASTSNESERDCDKFLPPLDSYELQNKNSEEIELLELQEWGSSVI